MNADSPETQSAAGAGKIFYHTEAQRTQRKKRMSLHIQSTACKKYRGTSITCSLGYFPVFRLEKPSALAQRRKPWGNSPPAIQSPTGTA